MVVGGPTGPTEMHRQAKRVRLTDQWPIMDGGNKVMAAEPNEVQRSAKRSGRSTELR